MTELAHIEHLKPTEIRFVESYIATGNVAEAARRAGYRADNPQYANRAGSQLMQRPLVRNAIDQAYRQAAKSLRLTTQKVLIDIERVREKAETEGNYAMALKASELQGKYLKMWQDKTDITVHNNQQINVMVEFVEPGAVLNQLPALSVEVDPW
jgi:hypothetical protein